MYKPTAVHKLLALALLAALGAQTATASDQELEDGLINALSLKKALHKDLAILERPFKHICNKA